MFRDTIKLFQTEDIHGLIIGIFVRNCTGFEYVRQINVQAMSDSTFESLTSIADIYVNLYSWIDDVIGVVKLTHKNEFVKTCHT